MEFRDLECVVALADTLSFTKAADKLNMAQPPLSRRLATLEARLGTPLFVRTRPLQLTSAGHFVEEQARQVLRRVTEIEAGVARIAAGKRSYLGIGFVGSILNGPLPSAIKAVVQAHPDVEIGLHELTTLEQRDALRDRRIDIGLGRLNFSDAPGLVRATVIEEPLVVACPTHHPLSNHLSVSLAQCAEHDLILYPQRPRPSFADQVLGIFEQIGKQPSVRVEVKDLQTALGLTASGMGLAIVPKSVEQTARNDIVFRPIQDACAVSPIIATYREGVVPDAAQTLLDQLFRATPEPSST
ncbi:LysR family transcriptional regulator [uncultured Tateyamaria sp.]|uniref:LysR family transcriptional regulator n=1 Tax=uncultured Tateyamaria sp. TaxID=455651 RepID=UPI0026133FC9|nr:LysR family transcriptional regulator [uncultured Tateyamaria sp.]